MPIPINPIQVLRRVVGNREPIAATMLDINGDVINLAGRSVSFRMVLISDGSVKVNSSSATVTSASEGKVAYSPSANDVNTAGTYAMYFVDDATPSRRWPYEAARFQLVLEAEEGDA